ncbi:MAG: hypothetical protein KDD42_10000 [Bdellovibrionales bacterium]|nr:hypothetical protein [Bdellovibrionales bacterium]
MNISRPFGLQKPFAELSQKPALPNTSSLNPKGQNAATPLDTTPIKVPPKAVGLENHPTYTRNATSVPQIPPAEPPQVPVRSVVAEQQGGTQQPPAAASLQPVKFKAVKA